jgi:phycocyanin alpha chain
VFALQAKASSLNNVAIKPILKDLILCFDTLFELTEDDEPRLQALNDEFIGLKTEIDGLVDIDEDSYISLFRTQKRFNRWLKACNPNSPDEESKKTNRRQVLRQLSDNLDSLLSGAYNAVVNKWPYLTTPEDPQFPESFRSNPKKLQQEFQEKLERILKSITTDLQEDISTEGTKKLSDTETLSLDECIGSLAEVFTGSDHQRGWYIEALKYTKANHGCSGDGALELNKYLDYSIFCFETITTPHYYLFFYKDDRGWYIPENHPAKSRTLAWAVGNWEFNFGKSNRKRAWFGFWRILL